MDSMLPLTQAKLRPPRLARELVHRPRLVERLNQASSSPLIILSAPAGYGKSTLVSDWQRQAPYPVTWLTLDEDDNDVRLFCCYLSAAVKNLFPHALGTAAALLDSPLRVPPARLASALSNELAELPDEFVLVLDDYHIIRNADVHQLMSRLIRHLPEQVHILITTRTDAPLPLALPRARGHVYDLRASDLRFTLDEVHSLIERTTGIDLPAETARLLEERTEGWAAGLHFAALALRESSTPHASVDELFDRSERGLMGYLLEEVLARSAPSVQDFLLKTAILKRFTVDTCDALLDPPLRGTSRTILASLDDGMPIVVLDEKSGWHRYHNLFQKLLRTRAQAYFPVETLRELHRRASRWYAAHDLVSEAIHHALAANDLDYAASLVQAYVQPALDREAARPLLEQWLALFPPDLLEKKIELVMSRLWLAALQLNIAAAPALVSRAEELLAKNSHLDSSLRDSYSASLAFFKLGLAFFAGDGARALDYARQVFEHAPKDFAYLHGNTAALTAAAYQMTGRKEAALRLLTEAMTQNESSSPLFLLRVLTGFAVVYDCSADLTNLRQTARAMLRASPNGSHLSLGWAHYYLGLTNYEWNNLAAAAQHFAHAAELRYSGNQRPCFESLGWLGLTQQAQGLVSNADAAISELLDFASESQAGSYIFDANAYRARLALIRGDTESAFLWAQGVAFDDKPHLWMAVEANLTRLCTLLEGGEREHLLAMRDETRALLAWAETRHNTRRIIQLNALLALAQDALGEEVAALHALQRSITLAEPGGFIRTYVDLGPKMARLLNRLLSRRAATAYVRRILAAFPQNPPPTLVPRAQGQGATNELFEPLTLRETQVLEGLARRLSDKEIAQELYISANTVKAHTEHIYQKLGVRSRQEAVRVAATHGLIVKPQR